MRNAFSIPFVAVLLVSTVSVSPSLVAAPPATLELGQPAPAFRLVGVDGRRHSLKEFAEAKLLVVVFTCNHCPTAQAYEQRITELAKDYRNRDVALVAISPNDPQAVRLDELGYTDVGDSLEDMKVRAKQLGWDFPYLFDGDQQAASRAYGPAATPHVFVFDQQRRLQYTGRIDDSDKPEDITTHDAKNAIDALLAGRPVPVAKTRTFGCSVKWSDKRESARESLNRWNQETASLERLDPAGLKKLVANDTDKLRLINVWATWCGPCTEEFPDLVTIHRMYRKRDFELITISADSEDEEAKVRKFLNEAHASCRNYLFVGKNEYQLVDAMDPKWQGALPYTMLIAPGGKVLYRHQDRISPLELRGQIADALGRVYK